MIIDFQHRQSAHCENGVISNLLNFHGLDISEPLAFGIGSGIFFTHLPFVKVHGIPGTSYRIWPGHIFKRLSKLLNIKVERQSFRNEQLAMQRLDELLERGQPVGMLTSVFYLPYLPEAFRFHFNAHNIVVIGKEAGNYIISDPVMPGITQIAPADLQRARFAKGTPEPKGKLYYPVSIPKEIDFKIPVLKGIRRAAFEMSRLPVPLFGAKGMNFLAKRIANYPGKMDDRTAKRYLINLIRMQEEIGTGGAGFRFIYAAFLKEAAQITHIQEFNDLADRLTASGDQLRAFAYEAARICKNRGGDVKSFADLASMLATCGDTEQEIFTELFQIAKAYK